LPAIVHRWHNADMFRSSIHTLRIFALTEGVSFLVLLGVAMPLKYVWGIPAAVQVVGWIHGLLFVAFCFALAFAFFQHRWPFWRGAVIFIAALVPFGPFVIDRRMRALERAEE
jgi:integral membrane protein